MLVLSRKPQESVILLVDGRRIEVMLVSVGHDKAKIGIDADRSVKIVRKELDVHHT